MKKRIRLKFAMMLAIVVMLGILAACSSSKTTDKSSSTKPEVTATTSAAPEVATKLKFWAPLNNSNVLSLVKDLNEVPTVKEWAKRTNVQFEFQHPSGDSASILQQFGVMMASGDLPDLMVWNWNADDSTNAGKLFNDGQIIKLNDLIDKYAPNLKKLMADHPEVAKQFTSDNGDIYVFPHLKAGQYHKYNTFWGPMIRQDWLDELGLKAPETIDDWETDLKAFKVKLKAPAPYITDQYFAGEWSPEFVGAFGVGESFYVDNGKIKYGPIEPGFKQFLATMQKWYKEGLIDPDYLTNDDNSKVAKITSGKTGAFHAYIGSGMGSYLAAFKQSDPKAKLSAVQYPVLNKGDHPNFTDLQWNYLGYGAVITKSNKHPEETIKALDYLYSDEGSLLKNFGIEGQTYTMVDGQPKYTDLIMNNPDKLDISSALGKYVIANYAFVGQDDDRYLDSFYGLPEQKEAVNIFSKYSSNSEKVHVPPISQTPQESAELAKIMTDIETYRSETTSKIILGTQSIDSYDKAVAQMQSMKINRAIEIKQAALDRYNKR